MKGKDATSSSYANNPQSRQQEDSVSLLMEWSPNQPKPRRLPPKQDTERSQLEQDRDLAARILAGDEAAFALLYDTYAPVLLRRIMRLTTREDLAEDCLQIVFMDVIQRISQYRGDGPLIGWLHRITTTTVLQQFRKQKRRTKLADGFAMFSKVSEKKTSPLPEKLMANEEMKQTLHECLEKVEPNKRMTILLCDLEGLKVEDAAQELDIPVGTLASRLHRGRHELNKLLTRELKRRGLSVEEWLHD